MNIAHGKFEQDRSTLGDRLRGLREQHGLSLRELAVQVGVTATALHSWECGRRNPKHKHVQAFADAFKLSRSELLSGVEGELSEVFAAMGDQRRSRASMRPEQLADVIADCKDRIAAAAGTSAERVRIVIEV